MFNNSDINRCAYTSLTIYDVDNNEIDDEMKKLIDIGTEASNRGYIRVKGD